jgi:hypothetical protein
LSACSWQGSGQTVLLLVPELLGARAKIVVAEEEVEADPREGDDPEVDVLLVLDERADRGFGAGDGGVPFDLCGLAQRPGAAARRSSALPVTAYPVSG